MTFGEAKRLVYGITVAANMVQDQRMRYQAKYPERDDQFKPVEECTEDELLAELNSTESWES